MFLNVFCRCSWTNWTSRPTWTGWNIRFPNANLLITTTASARLLVPVLVLFHSIPFIDNGRTQRPLTPIKYMDKTVRHCHYDEVIEGVWQLIVYYLEHLNEKRLCCFIMSIIYTFTVHLLLQQQK